MKLDCWLNKSQLKTFLNLIIAHSIVYINLYKNMNNIRHLADVQYGIVSTLAKKGE